MVLKKEIELYKKLESLEFRKQKIKEELEATERFISGEWISISSLVKTPSGKFSEKRAWKLIDELTECLQIFLNKICVYDSYLEGYIREQDLESSRERKEECRTKKGTE